jgi:hypothetical protein
MWLSHHPLCPHQALPRDKGAFVKLHGTSWCCLHFWFLTGMLNAKAAELSLFSIHF